MSWSKLYRCPDCGCVVHDPDKHTTFHALLAGIYDGLKQLWDRQRGESAASKITVTIDYEELQ